MARARKTFDVAELVIIVNYLCRTTDPESVKMRQGAINVLERVLFSTGNYKGFRYLLEGECEGNPGVRYKDGVPDPDYELRFKDTDRTRVQY